ncbi:hypothetical protein M5033_11130, partial [Neisseria meningitidis]|nr:hypothetical protein [Neisseria meningitidis]
AGIGRLRDLREAAALSGDLANMLKAYSAAETKEAQLALLDNLRPLQNSFPSRQPKPKHRFSAVFAPNTS